MYRQPSVCCLLKATVGSTGYCDQRRLLWAAPATVGSAGYCGVATVGWLLWAALATVGSAGYCGQYLGSLEMHDVN